MNTVLPTHTCFDDTTAIIQEMGSRNPKILAELVIVHAICLLPDTDKPYAHAWVEWKADAYFIGIHKGERVLIAVLKEEYRKELRIRQATQYSFVEAVKHNMEHCSCGPWLPEYKALCK